MHRRSLALLTVALLGLTACGSDSKSSDSTAGAVVETTVETEPTNTEPTNTEPVDTEPVDTSDTSVADTSVADTSAADTSVAAAGRPMVMNVPKRIGDGLIEDWSPDGTALIVLRVDEALSQEGCEGVKEPVFFLQPIDGGASTVAMPGHPEMNGSFVGTQPDTKDVVMLSGCEGYLGDLSVANQAANGVMSDPRVLTIADTAQAAELTGMSSLSLDGSALLLTGKAFAGDVEKVVSTRIDLETGASTSIETGGRGGAHIAEATEGRIVVSDGQAVYLLSADGTLIRTYEGTDFGLSRDGTRIAVIGGGTLGIAEVGADVTDPVYLPKSSESALLSFSPDGSAVAILAYDERGMVAVVRGGKVHLVDSGEAYGRLAWNPSGTAIAFNRFSGDFAVEDVMVAEQLGS